MDGSGGEGRTLARASMGGPWRLLAAAGPVIAASALAGFATTPDTEWYRSLAQPSFAPPPWLFGPVWTVLYVFMIVAGWRLLGAPRTPARDRALALFYGQLVLNAAWSYAFFALQSPAAGLVVLAALTACVLAAIRAFAPIDRVAAALFAPYAAWAGFASALNLGIVVLSAGA